MAAQTITTHLRGEDTITIAVSKIANGYIDICIGDITHSIFATLDQIEMMGCDIINTVFETRKNV